MPESSARAAPPTDAPRVETCDAVVVGAGPAGCAAAITFARAGRRVVVLDRASFPRDKICGDGLTTLALRELERLGLPEATARSWQAVGTAVVRSPSGRETAFALPAGRGTYAAVARRSDLDQSLVALARDAGAEVREADGLDAASTDAGGPTPVRVRTRSGTELASRWVIGADGMWSPLRKALGVAPKDYRGDWHAFRQYFADVAPAAATNLYVWFEADLLPGYAWSFPLPGGGANVGFGIPRDGPHRVQDMARLWPDLLARPHIAATLGDTAQPEARHKAWPIPARIGRLALSAAEGRALFVGDAAAATDPMTGEGIGQALLTGRFAAEAALAADDPAAAAERYRREVARELVADDRMARWLIRVLRHRKGARAALRVAGATPWTRANFARWLFEDEPRAVALTPRRWHRHLLGRDGAYR